jgi:hypothetical protein
VKGKEIMDNTFFYEENNNLYRIRIERDDDPWNPREENDGYIGTMVCEHPRYELGDVSRAKVENHIDTLLREYVAEKAIIKYVKNGKASNNLELIYDRHERMWQLYGDYYTIISPKVQHGLINDTDQSVDWLIDDIIEALPIGDKLSLLTSKGFLFLPLAIYDHSGITMWAGSKWDHFDSQWDCSDVGFIYTTKEKCIEQWGKDKSKWKGRAEKELQAEVNEYDCYLRGDVYGFHLDRYDAEDGSWDEDVESCWGYISDKWGEELAKEMDITSQQFMNEEDAEIAMANMHQIALEEKAERKVMSQAEYIFAI